MGRSEAHKSCLAGRKTQLKSSTILLVFMLFCALPLLKVSFSEDISAMLPAGENNSITRDFELLQQAPLAGKVLISIAADSISEEKLNDLAASMAHKMDSPLLQVADYSSITPQAVVKFMLSQAPNLTTENDLKKLRELTSDSAIKENLSAAKQQLISPSGIALRGIIAADPLNLRSIYLPKIGSLQNLPSVKNSGKYYFVSGDKALLIIAESNIPMTDSKNGVRLLQRFQEIKRNALTENNISPAQVTIEMLSGHSYTVANSSVIKGDILRVSIISLCALGLLFCYAFRRKGALSIFLAPGVAIMAGLGAASFIYRDISAIVIGFGAVLMGISIDFAVHTYFALAESPQDRAGALRRVRTPVLFGATTSCISFAALYISGIPGIKQLAVFSAAGITAACAYALLFIPRFCNSFPAEDEKSTAKPLTGHKSIVLGAAVLIFGNAAIGAFSNSFDTELKNLGYISQELREKEKHFQEKWGDMRSRSMLFASGKNLDEALQINEQVWADINKNLCETKGISIASILPSAATASRNRERWSAFWDAEKLQKTSTALIRESRELGFAPAAFTPAMKRLSAGPPELNIASVQEGPLNFLVKLLIPAAEGEAEQTVMTTLPDNARISAYYNPQKEKELGVRLVSQSRFKNALESEMERDIIRFISCSGLLVGLLVFSLFRNLRRGLLALFPALFGVAATFGMLGMLHIPLNIFHIVALPLVIGLGADYGIFMVFQEIKRPSAWTVKAVKISGLTTLAGFGVLVFARHPSLHALGSTVTIGISAALLCAVFVLPQLLLFNARDRKSEDGHV